MSNAEVNAGEVLPLGGVGSYNNEPASLEDWMRDEIDAELKDLLPTERVRRIGELIEFVNRVLVVELADRRSTEVAELVASRPDEVAEIANGTGISLQQIRKLRERAAMVRRRSGSAAA